MTKKKKMNSIGMAVLTATQAILAKSWVEGLFWSILFGASIRIVFFGTIFLHRFFKR